MIRLGDVFMDAEVARLYNLRAPYPDGVFNVLQRLAVAPRVVLDVGAGTGALARPMLEFADRVDAIDPSAAMIAEGRRLPGGGDARLRWQLGRLEVAELTPPYGLITAGASLHWLDLDTALPRLRDALAPGAVLAVVDSDFEHGDYSHDVVTVIKKYSELEHHRGTSALVEDLERSSRFELLGVERCPGPAAEESVEEYIEVLHSMSTLARVRLGERSAQFDADMRAVFARHGRDRVSAKVTGIVMWGRPR